MIRVRQALCLLLVLAVCVLALAQTASETLKRQQVDPAYERQAQQLDQALADYKRVRARWNVTGQ